MSKTKPTESPTFFIDYIVGYTYLDGTSVVKSLGPISPRCGFGQVDTQWIPNIDGNPYGAPIELKPVIERKFFKQQLCVEPGFGNPGGH